MSNEPPEVTPAQAREVIETWSSDARAAEAKFRTEARTEAKSEATKISLKWHLITSSAAALVSALLSAGVTVTFLNVWSPERIDLAGFELSLPAGGGEQDCARDSRSSDERPRFVCWRAPR